MAGDYATLAPFYDRIGLADFATQMTPRLLTYVQQNGWMGRRIVELGCGTGACMTWLAGRGYSVFGVDNAPEMLQLAQKAIDSASVSGTTTEADIRNLGDFERTDMAIALGVMNDLDNLRDLEAVFKCVAAILSKDRFFVFDMETIQGLSERGSVEDRTVFEDKDLIVFSRTRYDFERQMCTVGYELFERADAQHWNRHQAQHVLRAFPIQAVASLLRRQNFEVLAVLNTRLETLDLAVLGAPKVIFVAKKTE